METNTCDHTSTKYEFTICNDSLVHSSKYKCFLKNCSSVKTTGRHWSIDPNKFLILLSNTLEKLHFSGWCYSKDSNGLVLPLNDINLTQFNQLKHLGVEQTIHRFILPNNLERLIFDDDYNCPIVLSQKIKHIHIGCFHDTNAFITCIDNLPDSTKTLEIKGYIDECNYHLFVNLSHNICSIVFRDG